MEPAIDLQPFVDAQDPVFDRVLAELRRGRKVTHWMWFVFPQIAGLGDSEMTRSFAISSLDEAKAYLAHPVLGTRLRECTGTILHTQSSSAEEVFGSVDARKLRSSMTLFHRADPSEALFDEVLAHWFDGRPDESTDRLLEELARLET